MSVSTRAHLMVGCWFSDLMKRGIDKDGIEAFLEDETLVSASPSYDAPLSQQFIGVVVQVSGTESNIEIQKKAIDAAAEEFKCVFGFDGLLNAAVDVT